MKIDRVFSVSKERSCVLGISFDRSRSYPVDRRQWRQLYIQVLFWEFSLLIAWNKEATDDRP